MREVPVKVRTIERDYGENNTEPDALDYKILLHKFI
jgi:hypothetical protein